MSNNNSSSSDDGVQDVPLINDNTVRYLNTMLDILADPGEFDALLTTIKASTRGKEATEMHTRIRGLHYTIINAAVVAVLGKWEQILHDYLKRTKERGEPVDVERWDWLIEANQASIVVEHETLAGLESEQVDA